MTQAESENRGLYEFLCLSRQKVYRLVFVQQLCRSAFWVGLACIPLMYLRGRLGITGGGIFATYLLVSLAGAGVLTGLKHLQLRQVVSGLDLSADSHDRVSSGLEFLADPDPFKRLALREAEQWLASHSSRIACIWKWPREAPFALAVLIAILLLWWLASPAMVGSPSPVEVPFLSTSQSKPASQSRPTSKPTSVPSSRQSPPGRTPGQTSQPGQAGGQQPGGQQPGQASGQQPGQAGGQQPGQAGGQQPGGQQPGQAGGQQPGQASGQRRQAVNSPAKQADSSPAKQADSSLGRQAVNSQAKQADSSLADSSLAKQAVNSQAKQVGSSQAIWWPEVLRLE
ncbi:MAG: hypothetical protein NT031_03150 [Planctomycetota bacterium]|nr:hypothetical protein [Planctomycetota bacterium]